MHRKTLESLIVGATYECCNHDLVIADMFLTPTAIDLDKRVLVYEDAARSPHTKIFSDKADEGRFFYVMNIHDVRR
jgi:hypothetical protein